MWFIVEKSDPQKALNGLIRSVTFSLHFSHCYESFSIDLDLFQFRDYAGVCALRYLICPLVECLFSDLYALDIVFIGDAYEDHAALCVSKSYC